MGGETTGLRTISALLEDRVAATGAQAGICGSTDTAGAACAEPGRSQTTATGSVWCSDCMDRTSELFQRQRDEMNAMVEKENGAGCL